MITKQIANKFAFAKIHCCNERCNIRVNVGKNFVILKGEMIAGTPAEKMCDCIIFLDDKKIVLVELKSRVLEPSKISEKFIKSAEKSISIATSFDRKGTFRLFLILLAKSYSDNSAYDRLRRSKLKIHGKKYHIRFGRCGCSLDSFVN